MEKVLGFIIVLFVLAALGYASRMDEVDAERYEAVRAEILLSAPTWAVTE